MSAEALDPAEHPWMTAAPTRAVLDALSAVRPNAARFVGGCVRDAVMQRPVGDIDIATPLRPDDVVDALEAVGLRAVPTGLAHGTVTAISDGQPFEITTLRRDVSTDGRHAEVSFTEDWERDSQRRDFRLNAIYADPDGTLFDPQNGVADARSGRVVFIGDPDKRIREDYLRVLRFFRFSAWYVDGPLDEAGLEACKRRVGGMKRLAAERVWAELKKLLRAPDPREAIRATVEIGLTAQLLPEAFALDLIEALVAREQAEGWEPDPLLRTAAFIPRMGDLVARVAKRLKLSNAERDRLEHWVNCPFTPRAHLGADQAAIARALYTCDQQAALDRARLAYALDVAAGEADGAEPDSLEADYRSLIAFTEAWEKPEFPLTGRDLVDAGVQPGPRLGVALAALEALWVKSNFRAGRDQLLSALPLVTGS